MPGESIEPFQNNWAYLRTELAWLDRVLSLAIAKQSNETTAINRLARSRADRVTSHWWKGLVNLGSMVASDSPAEVPRRRSGQGNYQQQLETRIQVSQQAGIVLGIPALCDRLQLSKFEKQVILLTLAPEVSHRYGQIYAYLQEREQTHQTGLPTVDLLLRLLCRTDAEWRLGRESFTADSPLLRHELIEVQSLMPESLLGRSVKLADSLVHFLLADPPSLSVLEGWLPNWEQRSTQITTADFLQFWQPKLVASANPWNSLVLPDHLLNCLKHLVNRMQMSQQVYLPGDLEKLDTIVVFSGPPGTGKQTAAQTIAQALNIPLCHIDLAMMEPETYPALLQQLTTANPNILVLESAQKWFGRSAELTEVSTHWFLTKRQQFNRLTILCVDANHQVRPRWRQQMKVLEFPIPDQNGRLRLWHQALPETVCQSSGIDWFSLSKLVLTGGKIFAIAQDATIYAASENAALIEGSHLLQALTLHQPHQRSSFVNKILRK